MLNNKYNRIFNSLVFDDQIKNRVFPFLYPYDYIKNNIRFGVLGSSKNIRITEHIKNSETMEDRRTVQWSILDNFVTNLITSAALF